MNITSVIGNYTDEQIVAIVKKMVTLLDEPIDGYSSVKVRDYISRLSAYRGRLITVEFQLKRLLVDKEEKAVEDGILTGKSKELRDIQLNEYTKNERDNYETIRKLREELSNKSLLCSSILKSIDVNNLRGNSDL